MQLRGLALVFGLAASAFACMADTAASHPSVIGAAEPFAAVYIDSIAFTDTFTVGASGSANANSRFIASGFSTAQNIDFTSTGLRGSGLTLAEDFAMKPAVVGTPVSDSQPATPSAEALKADAAIEPETYAPLLAGLGVLGFLAMRRKAH